MRNILRVAILAFLALCGGYGPASAQSPFYPCVPSQDRMSCAAEVTPKGVSTGAESSHVIKASAGDLIGFQVNNWSTSTGLTVMLLDATVAPSNGTLATCPEVASGPNNTQTSPCIMKWYGVAAAGSSASPGTIGVTWQGGPALHFLNGMVLVCSSTGPTTLTLSANCTFSAEVQ